VFQSDQARQLAKRLQALKARTNRSYEALARRVGVSSSTLHRYCHGETVPSSYEVIARFGMACGASEQEAAELLRYWALTMNTGQVMAPSPVAESQAGSRWRWLWLPAALLGVGLAGGTAIRRRRAKL
jgi:transcriptional regulator with XRE-family HTH domain